MLKGFDIYAKDIYDLSDKNENLTSVVRTVYMGNIFGSASRREGYSNMADLQDFIEAGKDKSSKSADVIEALNDCVSYKVNGDYHSNACGLSVFYPFGPVSSDELNIYKDICPSSYYLGFIDKIIHGALNSDISGYDNSDILSLYNSFYNTDDYSNTNGTYGYSTQDGFDFDEYSDSNSQAVTLQSKPHVGNDGHYSFTVSSDTVNNIIYVEASVYKYNEDTQQLYELGDTANVEVNYETGEVKDNFEGKWFALPDGQLLSSYITENKDNYALYYAPVILNDKKTNIQFKYDKKTKKAEIFGVCDNVYQ